MANTKRRCSVCKDYYPAEEMRVRGAVATCTNHPPVYSSLKPSIAPPKRKAKKARKPRRYTGAPIELRRKIRQRDGNRCRWCGRVRTRLECHHIKYRSEGGPNHTSNLIALCDECHSKAHSNKKIWQPVLLATIWLHYVEGKVLRVPDVEKVLLDRGFHPSQRS